MTVHTITALLLAVAGGILCGLEPYLSSKYKFNSEHVGCVLIFGGLIYLTINFTAWAMAV